ncbi:MAG: TetR/AcrR family transcriptional regulator, partial [Huintestinicola sp.]
QEIIGRTASFEANEKFLKMDTGRFVEGIELQDMYMDMYFASEGYLWEKSQQGQFNVDEVEKDFEKMIEFWKKIYLRKD